MAATVTVTCPNCYEEFATSASPGAVPKCPECGAVMPPLAEISEQPRDLRCPRCGQIDMVLKTSVARARGIRSSGGIGVGLNTGGSVGAGVMVGRDQDEISESLEPPDEPQPYGGGFVVSAGGIITGLILSIVSVSSDSGGPGQFLLGLTIAAASAISIPLMIRYNDREFPGVRRRWETAIGFWNNSYYCCRCDAVFLSGSKESFSPQVAFSPSRFTERQT